MERLIVDGLAVFRLTRLVNADKITEPLRDAWIRDAYRRAGRVDVELDIINGWADVLETDSDPPKAGYFITCPWCVSMYVALGAVAARRYAPRLWAPIARAAAFSGIAGFLSER